MESDCPSIRIKIKIKLLLASLPNKNLVHFCARETKSEAQLFVMLELYGHSSIYFCVKIWIIYLITFILKTSKSGGNFIGVSNPLP